MAIVFRFCHTRSCKWQKIIGDLVIYSGTSKCRELKQRHSEVECFLYWLVMGWKILVQKGTIQLPVATCGSETYVLKFSNNCGCKFQWYDVDNTIMLSCFEDSGMHLFWLVWSLHKYFLLFICTLYALKKTSTLFCKFWTICTCISLDPWVCCCKSFG